MKDEDNHFIERLKRYVKEHSSNQQQMRPPVSEAEWLQAEAQLGFALPPLLKRIYCEVSNGGFGPAYGLYQLNDREDPQALQSDSLVTTYLALRALTPERFTAYWVNSENDHENRPLVWPEKIISICDWGCNSYSYADCSLPGYPVLHLDHNTTIRELILESPSFFEWLRDWLDNSN